MNEVKMSGTITRLQEIHTRTGTTMARCLLKVDKSAIACIFLKNVADRILQLSDGAEIEVHGTGSINNWKDKDENWHNDFQISCWTVIVNGEEICYEKTGKQAPRQSNRPQGNTPPPRQQGQEQPPPPEDHSYRGGPF